MAKHKSPKGSKGKPGKNGAKAGKKKATQALEKAKGFSVKPVNKAVAGCAAKAHDKGAARKVAEKIRPVKIRVSVFFDGTFNNRTNVGFCMKGGDGGSFGNDFSNISKLEQLWKANSDYDHSFSLYIEGIGTENHQKDDYVGAITGDGDTGIVAKVERGINYVIQGIQEHGKKKIDCIHVDAFGFSRGAAAARHFIYYVLHKRDKTVAQQLRQRGFSVGVVKAKFVGLFDTVSSDAASGLHLHDLNLGVVKEAEQVVQLAAAEEHRKLFPLTNIGSAGNGVEIFLPGVHADIGGGYQSSEDEKDRQILDIDTVRMNQAEKDAVRREREWLVDAGWYRPDEISDLNFWNELKVNRTGIRNDYARIPLHIMKEFADEQGVKFRGGTLKSRFPIPHDLQDVKAELDAYVSRVKKSRHSKPDDWFKNHSFMMKALRHRYLHFSAYYGSGKDEPHFSGGGPVNGRRERVIYDG